MIDGTRLLISVAAGELTKHEFPGSLLALKDLRASPVSAELAAGINLLEAACEATRTELLVVARPEIFTHGAVLEWLTARTGAARHHVYFSDGETVRMIPGLANHVFFYRTGSARHAEAFLALRRRAPELLGVIRSQVNTAFLFDEGSPRVRPKTTLLARTDPAPAPPRLLPFFVTRGQLDRDVTAIAGQESVEPDAVTPVQSMTYVALNQATLDSTAFMAGLVNHLVAAYTDPTRGLILQSPLSDKIPQAEENGIKCLLAALRRHAPSLPSGMPKNVFVHLDGNGLLPSPLMAGSARIVAHESYGFWHFAPDFYASFGILTLLREKRSAQHKTALRSVVTGLTGRAWEEATLPSPHDSSLARFTW